MSGVAEYGNDGDAAAVARLLDPVSLEARLADARARREATLAARAALTPGPLQEAEPEFDEASYLSTLSALAMRGAGVLVAGLAGLYALVAAGCFLLAPDTSAPEAFLLAEAPPLPAPLPPAPTPGGAGWAEPATPLPLFAALAPPVFTPAAEGTLPATAASRTRTADARNLAAAAPVLRQAAASSLITVASRSAPAPAYFPLQATDTASSQKASARREAVRRSSRNGWAPNALPAALRKVVHDVARDLKRAGAQAQEVARSAGFKAPAKHAKGHKARPGKAARGKSKARKRR